MLSRISNEKETERIFSGNYFSIDNFREKFRLPISSPRSFFAKLFFEELNHVNNDIVLRGPFKFAPYLLTNEA